MKSVIIVLIHGENSIYEYNDDIDGVSNEN